MLVLACDHAGFELKEYLKQYFTKNNIDFIDIGALKYDKDDDYPDIVVNGVKKVLENTSNKGIFVCGSGIGMCMASNRFKGIRCVVAYKPIIAKLARKDEDANVLALGARLTSKRQALKIIKTFLTSPFEGGRHLRRINKY